MSLSNLSSLTEAQFNALRLSPFSATPSETETGNPPPTVSIQLRGWVSGTSTLAFTVNNSARSGSGLNIDSAASETISVAVVAGSNPNDQTEYYTVDMGTGNGPDNDWTVSFAASNTTESGTWVFVKGKDPDGSNIVTDEAPGVHPADLTSLQSLTETAYDALTLSWDGHPPTLSKTGNPPDSVTIELGGWVQGQTNILAFKVVNSAMAGSGVGIDPSQEDTVDVNVVAGSNPRESTSYYTINMGSGNGPSNEWRIAYATSSTTQSGTWVFVKGKDPDEVSVDAQKSHTQPADLTSLQPLTQPAYDALNLSWEGHPPAEPSKTGNPPDSVTIELGGWVQGQTNILAFKVINNAMAGSGLGIDPTLPDTVDVNVVAGSNPRESTSYYTINMGPENGPNQEWRIAYATSSTTQSGTWVFVKGKDDVIPDGCLGGITRLFKSN